MRSYTLRGLGGAIILGVCLYATGCGEQTVGNNSSSAPPTATSQRSLRAAGLTSLNVTLIPADGTLPQNGGTIGVAVSGVGSSSASGLETELVAGGFSSDDSGITFTTNKGGQVIARSNGAKLGKHTITATGTSSGKVVTGSTTVEVIAGP